MKRRYTHLFFDLDHTLWDHYKNANETLEELHSEFDLDYLGFTAIQLQQVFHEVNHQLWYDYHLGEIDQESIRKERFPKVMHALGVSDYQHSSDLGKQYLLRCPKKSNLMPNTLEVLDYLKQKYAMTIITNGFHEIQSVKIANSGLQSYFDRIVTSGEAGCLKPHRGIFDYALESAQVRGPESVMIGDNPVTDITGAKEAGIDQIYYNSRECNDATEPTFRIDDLLELKGLL